MNLRRRCLTAATYLHHTFSLSCVANVQNWLCLPFADWFLIAHQLSFFFFETKYRMALCSFIILG